MRKSVMLFVVLAILVVSFACQPVRAEEPTTKSEIKLIQKSDHTEISITQQAEVLAPRDRISITLGIEVRGNNTRNIQSEINKRMATAIEKIKNNPSLNVETGSYSVSRPYDSQAKDAERWRGSQDLTIVSDDFEAALAMAGDLQNDGLIMGDMRFFVAPETLRAEQDNMTTSALQLLKERANRVANDLGMKIERYKNITIGNASEDRSGSRNKASASKAAKSEKVATTPAIAAGSALVALQVNAVVILVQ